MEKCKFCGHKLKTLPITGAGFELYSGDAIEVMQSFAPKSFDAIITDPPYGSGGLSLRDRLNKGSKKYYLEKSAKTLPEINGDSMTPDGWADNMRRFCMQSRRLLKDDGVFLAFIDWRNLGALQAIVWSSGIKVRGFAVWDKTQHSRPYPGGFRSQSEFIIWGSVDKLPRDDIYLPGIFKVSTDSKRKKHIMQKPTDLMRQLVQICKPGGAILDSFAGSSSTGVAALLEGYTFTGIESVTEYVEISKHRLESRE